MRPEADAGSGGPTQESPVPARRLRVRHETRYRYSRAVDHAHHIVRLRPRDTDTQTISHWRLEVEPSPETVAGSGDGVAAQRWQGLRDVWGNWSHTFSHAIPHQRLVVVSSFVASIEAGAAVDLHRSPAWENVAHSLRYRASERMPDAAEFVLGTELAPRAPSLRLLVADLMPAGRPVLAVARALMLRIHEQFAYVTDSTDVGTDAIAALAQREGVCQDFAHVMIGALRSMGLAARYVSGYVLTQPPPGKARLIGADASHAWVQVWCPLNGWVAFDPTNAVVPDLDHVTLAWGRDYADVAPLHGVIRGGGKARLTVAVTVAPIDDEPVSPG